jgi:isopenicillin N synthase-like dioxygenase
MTTSFSALPIVDVGALRDPKFSAGTADGLSKELYNVFSTTGFAYLVNTPLSSGTILCARVDNEGDAVLTMSL